MNIDVTKIEGFDGMTAEEKVKALMGYEYDDNSQALKEAKAEVERYKNAQSKASSEAAEYKRQLREKMSDEEKQAKDNAEKFETLKTEHDALLKKVKISENKAKFLALGYSEDLANETAEALFNGDTEKVFANQKAYQETLESKIKADVLKSTPKPVGGGGDPKVITAEELKKMSYKERVAFKNANPELYGELTK